MKMAVLEGASGVGDNTTEIRIPLPGWTLLNITDLVSGTAAEEYKETSGNYMLILFQQREFLIWTLSTQHNTKS